MAHLIATNHDGLQRFYSPGAGRGIGAGGGWTENAREGLAFARKVDAEKFLEYHLPHVQPIANVVEMEVGSV